MDVLISITLLAIPTFVLYRSFKYLKGIAASYAFFKSFGLAVGSFIIVTIGSMLLESIVWLLIPFYALLIYFIFYKTKITEESLLKREENIKNIEKQKTDKAKALQEIKKSDVSKIDNVDYEDDGLFNITVTSSTTYKNTNEDEDSFEGWFYEDVYDYIDCKKTFKLKYKDANGNITNRIIDMYRFGEISEGFFILAYCRLRNENRTFRTDRMLECIDMQTGECISDIQQYFSDLYYNSEQYKEIKAWRQKQEEKAIQEEYYETFTNKYKVLLKVLMYIVKCDGTFNQREKAIVKEIFENLEDNNELLTDKLLQKVYKNTPLPSLQAFKINVNKLLEDNNIDIDLLKVSQNIIATQKSVHPAEAHVLEYLTAKVQNK